MSGCVFAVRSTLKNEQLLESTEPKSVFSVIQQEVKVLCSEMSFTVTPQICLSSHLRLIFHNIQDMPY